ncbi:hypothetical protein [Zavarzinella formosa]|uniref:hypothetical protein n=1 Tax=Zavarzinella formosa TaxID=360055 RepID=UPI000302FB74|nr:hypothetical protein [Zavarzinella formosa]
MNLIVPEILTEGRGLSMAVIGTAIAVGLALWLFGWRGHRFWIVVGVTVTGGLYGLSAGQATGVNMIAMGIMLALSAGLLALELARVFAFLAAGTVVWLAVGALFPQGKELWLVFLAGGLVGILFYRLWTMTLTSFLGTIVATHAILILLGEITKFDSVAFAREHPTGLNIGIGLVSAMGLAIQGAQVRWAKPDPEEKPKDEKKKEKEKLPKDVQALKDAFSKPAK